MSTSTSGFKQFPVTLYNTRNNKPKNKIVLLIEEKELYNIYIYILLLSKKVVFRLSIKLRSIHFKTHNFFE